MADGEGPGHNTPISIVPRIQEKQTLERLARLWGLVEKYEADLRANPQPFLKKAADEYCNLARVIDEIRSVLTVPIAAFDSYDYTKPMKHPFQDAYDKLQRIDAIVWEVNC